MCQNVNVTYSTTSQNIHTFCNPYVMWTLHFEMLYILWCCRLCEVYVLKTLRFGTLTLCAATFCNITSCDVYVCCFTFCSNILYTAKVCHLSGEKTLDICIPFANCLVVNFWNENYVQLSQSPALNTSHKINRLHCPLGWNPGTKILPSWGRAWLSHTPQNKWFTLPSVVKYWN